MRTAEARVAEVNADVKYEAIMRELWRLHRSMPLESFFKLLDEFADGARARINAAPDPDEKTRLHDLYSRVLTSAVDLACNVQS